MSDLAYTAGIIDGEGCVRLAKYKNINGLYSYMVQVSVGNTDRRMTDRLQSLYGGTVSFRESNHVKGKDSWIWSLNGMSAAMFLTGIEPFAIVKKSRIRLALNVLKMKTGTKRGKPYTAEQRRRLDACWLAIKKANHRGKVNS